MFILVNIVMTQYHDAYMWYKHDHSGLTCAADEQAMQVLLYAIIITEYLTLFLEAYESAKLHLTTPLFEYKKTLSVISVVFMAVFITMISLLGSKCTEVIMDRGRLALGWGDVTGTSAVAISLILPLLCFHPTVRTLSRVIYVIATFIYFMATSDYPGSHWCMYGTGIVAIDAFGEIFGYL